MFSQSCIKRGEAKYDTGDRCNGDAGKQRHPSAARPKQLDVLNTAAKRILLIIQFSMLNSRRGCCFASTIMRVFTSCTPENKGGSYKEVRKRFFFPRFFCRKAFITVNKQ